MVSTPLAGFVHFGDVVVDLAAVVAVADDIAINSRAIRFEPALAFGLMVSVSERRDAECGD
jgi:hypothetical protein